MKKNINTKNLISCDIAEVKSSNDFIVNNQQVIKKKQEVYKENLNKINKDFPYKAKPIVTEAEKSFYNYLDENLTQRDRIVILSKVRIADIVEVEEAYRDTMEYFYKISSKHIDYVICKRESLEIICAIELYDYFHDEEVIQKTDVFKQQVFEAAGIPLVNIRKLLRPRPAS